MERLICSSTPPSSKLMHHKSYFPQISRVESRKNGVFLPPLTESFRFKFSPLKRSQLQLRVSCLSNPVHDPSIIFDPLNPNGSSLDSSNNNSKLQKVCILLLPISWIFCLCLLQKDWNFSIDLLGYDCYVVICVSRLQLSQSFLNLV